MVMISKRSCSASLALKFPNSIGKRKYLRWSVFTSDTVSFLLNRSKSDTMRVQSSKIRIPCLTLCWKSGLLIGASEFSRLSCKSKPLLNNCESVSVETSSLVGSAISISTPVIWREKVLAVFLFFWFLIFWILKLKRKQSNNNASIGVIVNYSFTSRQAGKHAVHVQTSVANNRIKVTDDSDKTVQFEIFNFRRHWQAH